MPGARLGWDTGRAARTHAGGASHGGLRRNAARGGREQ